MTQSKVPGPNLGTVTISGTVTEKQDQTANVAMTWTSATALNTTTATYAATGYGTANVALRAPTTATAGAVTIEVSQDGTDWVPAGAVRQDNSQAENPVPLAYFPGTNGTRIYAFSIDAFTLVRVKLTTVIVGAGNTVVTISAVAGGIEPIVAVRPRLLATYNANYRLASAAGAPQLGFTPVANTDKQLATIYHAASAIKTVRLRHVSININNGAAANYTFELRALGAAAAPATGNPTVTPRSNDSIDPAAEATCLALPTTAGTDAAPNSPVSPTYNWQSAAFAATTNPSGLNGAELVLYDHASQPFDSKPLTMRAGVAEGFAIIGRASAVAGLNFTAYVRFTEEAP